MTHCYLYTLNKKTKLIRRYHLLKHNRISNLKKINKVSNSIFTSRVLSFSLTIQFSFWSNGLIENNVCLYRNLCLQISQIAVATSVDVRNCNIPHCFCIVHIWKNCSFFLQPPKGIIVVFPSSAYCFNHLMPIKKLHVLSVFEC